MPSSSYLYWVNFISSELETQVEEVKTNEGILTKSQIEVINLFKISERKRAYLENLSNFNPYDRIENLKNLFSMMQTELEGHFKKDLISKTTIDINDGKYNFYNAKDSLDDAGDSETAREICEVGFTCYEKIIIAYLKVGLPTSDR